MHAPRIKQFKLAAQKNFSTQGDAASILKYKIKKK